MKQQRVEEYVLLTMTDAKKQENSYKSLHWEKIVKHAGQEASLLIKTPPQGGN